MLRDASLAVDQGDVGESAVDQRHLRGLVAGVEMEDHRDIDVS